MKVWKGSASHNSLWVESTRYVTIASALSSDEYWKYRGTWRRYDRKLSIYPGGKRDSMDLGGHPDTGLEDTVAAHMKIMNLDELGMSNKFKRAWERESEDDDIIIDGVDRAIYEIEHADSEV